MRDSAESFDPAYGRVRRAGRNRRQYFDDEATSARRDRHLPRLVAEDAHDATDGVPVAYTSTSMSGRFDAIISVA